MTLGEKIREARIDRGYTQVELAEKLGKGRRTIIDWEFDKSFPRTRKTYQALADALEVPVGYLLTDDADFVLSAGEQFGSRGKKDAQELVTRLTGLFAGGDMAEEDLDAMMFAIQKAYVDAKMANKKYTPYRYRKPENESDNEPPTE